MTQPGSDIVDTLPGLVDENTSEAEIIQKIQLLQRRLGVLRTSQSQRQLGATDSKGSLKPDETETKFELSGRLLIVANRLPVTLSRSSSSDNDDTNPGKSKGSLGFTMSSGGLVSAMMGIKGVNLVWIGWPGSEVDDEDKKDISKKLLEKKCIPVFLNKRIADLYYDGFANTILWPLYHYIQPDIEVIQGADDQFAGYQAANRAFAQVVIANYKEGDVIWVQDYHLFLLPSIIRAVLPSAKIGFFLHIPFPSTEIMRTIPWREDILNGVLSSDLIGFHTHDFARHFRDSCQRILGNRVTTEGVEIEGGFAHVGAFPIGIDAERFLNALPTPAVQKHITELQQKFAGKKLILGIDRLDYTKGLPHKLYAMERFYEKNPEFVGKVVMVQIAVPSRVTVPEYQKLSSKVHELVGRINGRFGSVAESCISFLDTSIPFDYMCALYRVADSALITSVRDGMNLVAFEYLACQSKAPLAGDHEGGVLILSEFTGAAQCVGSGAIRVNPWDVNEVADAIRYSLTMSLEERMEHNGHARRYVQTHTAQHWAETFLKALWRTATSSLVAVIPNELDLLRTSQLFKQSGHRLIVCSLLDTLTAKRVKVTTEGKGRLAVYSKASTGMAKLVDALAQDPHTTVLVVTSQNRDTCDRIIGDTQAWLAPENGYFLRRGGKEMEWETMFDNVDFGWREEVLRLFKYFTVRTPKSFIEERESTLSWHYHDCEDDFGEGQARELVNSLLSGAVANAPCTISRKHKTVSARPTGVTQLFLVDRLLTELEVFKGKVDFVMCIGANIDEEVFQRFESRKKNPAMATPRLLPRTPPQRNTLLDIQITSPATANTSTTTSSTSASSSLLLPANPTAEPVVTDRTTSEKMEQTLNALLKSAAVPKQSLNPDNNNTTTKEVDEKEKEKTKKLPNPKPLPRVPPRKSIISDSISPQPVTPLTPVTPLPVKQDFATPSVAASTGASTTAKKSDSPRQNGRTSPTHGVEERVVITTTVGCQRTFAQAYVKDVATVQQLFESLVYGAPINSGLLLDSLQSRKRDS